MYNFLSVSVIMTDLQMTLGSHLAYLLINVLESPQIAHCLFLVDFTLGNEVAALAICLPPSCGLETQLKLSPDLQPSLPSSPFLCRFILSGVGVKPLGSDTVQEDEAAEGNEEMYPVIGLPSSFCISFSFSFMSQSTELEKNKKN